MNYEKLYGNAQRSIADGKYDDAYKILKKIYTSLPEHPGVLYLLGICQSKSGNKVNAIRNYRKTLELMPDFVEASNNLALDLKALGQMNESLYHFRHAIKIRPDFYEAKINLASLLLDMKNLDEAFQLLKDLMESNHSHPMVISNYGRLLLENRYPKEAQEYFVKALHSCPNDLEIVRALFESSKQCKSWSAFGEAVNTYIKANPTCLVTKGLLHEAALFQSNWTELSNIESQFFESSTLDQKKIGIKPFSILCRFSKAEDQLNFISQNESYTKSIKINTPQPERQKIKIAYLSSDFKDHPISYLASGIFKSHDLESFEVFAIATDRSPTRADFFRNKIKESVCAFHEAGSLSDDEIIHLLKEIDPDILIDLNGHTSGSRPRVIKAHCAPVQIQFLGFPGTMASSYIDYTITDRMVTPLEFEKFYKEKLIVLPECFQPNDQTRSISYFENRLECGLPDQGFVFCCFNQSIKITRELFETWLRILKNTPDSLLWLIGDNSHQVNNMVYLAEQKGISHNRLIFADRIDYSKHLGRYALADLVLDTFPFNGGTTSSDALWAGAPIITMVGETYASRMSASLLHSLGLDELITDSLITYEELACDLAINPSKTAALRNKLHRSKIQSHLFNIQRFTYHFENGLRMANELSRQRLEPKTLVVPRIAE